MLDIGSFIEVTKTNQPDLKIGIQGTVIGINGDDSETGEYFEIEVEWPSGATSVLIQGEDEWKEIDEIKEMGDVEDLIEEEIDGL